MVKKVNFLSMIGHGTNGTDGIPEGIHLRWSFEDKLGFPPCFKLYRRGSDEGNKYHFPIEDTPIGDLLLPYSVKVIMNDTLTFKLDTLIREGAEIGFVNVEVVTLADGTSLRCLHITSGELTILFSKPISRMELTFFLEANSKVRLTGLSNNGELYQPYPLPGAPLGIQKIAFDLAGATGIKLSGTNIRLTGMAAWMESKGGGWKRINDFCGCGLPVNQEGTPYTNDVYASIGKDLAMALCRLGYRNLAESPITATQFVEFKSMLLTMTEEGKTVPVGWNLFPGKEEAPETTEISKTVEISKYDFLLVQSLQVFFAKIVGLYFTDTDVDNNQYYDYKVTAEWPEGNKRRLSHEILFNEYTVDQALNPIQQLDNQVVLLAPSKAQVVDQQDEFWRTEKGLKITSGKTAIFISFLKSVTEVQLVLHNPAFTAGNTLIEIEAYRNTYSVYVDKQYLDVQTGIIRLRFEQIDYIKIHASQVVISRIQYDFGLFPIGEQSYVICGLKKQNYLPLASPLGLTVSFIPGGTISNEDGTVTEKPYLAGLRWTVNENQEADLISLAPVLYHLERQRESGAIERMTEEAPLFVSPPENESNAYTIPVGWPRERQYMTDAITQDVPTSYRVAALDLFGRQSNFTDFISYEVTQPKPPHPIDVRAKFLDYSTYDSAAESFSDSTLIVDEQNWLRANQKNAIVVRWKWPENFQLQAPDVDGFTIHFKQGWLNNYTGMILTPPVEEVLAKSSLNLVEKEFAQFPILEVSPDEMVVYTFKVTIDIYPIPPEPQFHSIRILERPVVPADAFRLCWLTQGNHSFLILKNDEEHDPTLWALKLNDQPTQNKGFGVAVTDDKAFYVNYRKPENWPIQLHQEMKDVRLDYTVYIEDPEFPDPAITASIINKVRYGQIGVSSFANTVTGSVSPPATIMAIYREAPTAPVAFQPIEGESIQALIATPANVYGKSSFALRWDKIAAPVGFHVFRALDETLFKVDNTLRLSRSLSVYETFTDSAFNSNDVAVVRNIPYEPNHLLVSPHYTNLTPGQLQILASLPDNGKAFTKIQEGTIDQTDPQFADRVTEIPDPVNGASYSPDEDTLLFIDKTLNGQSNNNFFYALKSVDTNGLSSVLSFSTPPVEIPKTTPPPPPVITSISGGENQITIRWAKNPGAKIAGYLVYRTQELKQVGDWRKMELIKINVSDSFSVAVDEANLPEKEFEFIDTTVMARQPYYYGIIAVGLSDEGKWLRSKISNKAVGQGYDQILPEPPVWDAESSGWVYVDDSNIVYEWNGDISGALNPVPVIRLVWLEAARINTVLLARNAAQSNITGVIANWIPGEEELRGKKFYLDRTAVPGVSYVYVGKSKSASGLLSVNQSTIEIQP